jgi:hypothetical protein
MVFGKIVGSDAAKLVKEVEGESKNSGRPSSQLLLNDYNQKGYEDNWNFYI